MVIATGISAQVGAKAESVYGTPVTVDRFWEFVSEGIKHDIFKVTGKQIGAGRFLRNDRVKTVLRGAGGPVDFIVLNKGFGLLMEHSIGQNTISGAGANKTHTIIPDALALQGKSLTFQVGRPDIGGTVRPFTYEGGKVTEWEFKCAVDQPLHFIPTFDFENVLTATGLASASYPSTQEMFIFSEGALTIGGTTTFVKEASIKGNNGLVTDRRGLTNTKKEPLARGLEDYLTGNLVCEFEDLTAYAAWLAGTQAQLVLTFTLATVIPTTAVPYSLTITIPAIEYTGETPNVADEGIVMMPRPFRGLYNGSNPIITVAYVTSDTVS